LDAFRGNQFKPTVILLISPFLMVTWRCFFWPDVHDDPATGAVQSFVACLVLMGIVPALIVKFVFRERLADYGFGFGIPIRTIRVTLLLTPVFIIAGYVASSGAGVRDEYPVNPTAGESGIAFLYHAITYLAIYVGWEFYFRGFLQFGLKDAMGPANAILVQVLASCLLHIGKPTAELYAAILGGILWGILAYRTKSILPGMIQHYSMGLSVDWFICFGST
jgi:membrane protease YdiL (CAAX protease family)